MVQNVMDDKITLKIKIMKLSLEALKERAEAIASKELLENIAGGIAQDCHTCAEQARQPNNIK
jgi:hypothetical protein